ncbi:MAG: hypothetical protein AAF236_16040, partial [Verrucomicrobiota bacterium]
LALPRSARDPELQKAIDEFETIQNQLRSRGQALLANQQIQAKLSEILKIAPGHLSAKYLLFQATRRPPIPLTLVGSMTAIDRKAAPLLRFLGGDDLQMEDQFAKDQLAEAISGINRVRPLLDERTRSYADAIVDFSGYLRVAVTNPPTSRNKIIELRNNLSSSGENVSREMEALMERPDVRSELMTEEE